MVTLRGADPDVVKTAIATMIEATFDEAAWMRLGMATDTVETIRSHGRLLRSLRFGDEDYLHCVWDVLPKVLGQSRREGTREVAFNNLDKVARHLDLEKWLRENEPSRHRQLYGDDTGSFLDDLEASDQETLASIHEYLQRIRQSINDDPALAIGSAKELLESVLKSVLGLHGSGPETKLEMPQLAKRANIKLGIDPAGEHDGSPGAASRRRIIGGLNSIVNGMAELRNAGLGTGHGVSQRPEIDQAMVKLAVSAAAIAAAFYRDLDADMSGEEHM